jgi:hypothetical protein
MRIPSRAPYVIALVMIAGAFPGVFLHAQETESSRFRVNAAEIVFNGRVQTQFNTTTADTEPDTEWLLRRVRMETLVRVDDLVSGRVVADFAGDRVALKDAFMRLSFSPGLALTVGNAHRPFGILSSTSSAQMLPVERGARIRGVPAAEHYNLVAGLGYSERDVGLQVHGSPTAAPLAFRYAAGWFRGPLARQVPGEDSHQFVASVRVRPVPRWELGGSWSSREFQSGDELAPDLRRGHAWAVHSEYGAYGPGLHLLGELAVGDENPHGDSRFTGVQGLAGYRMVTTGRVAAIEPMLRVSHGSTPDVVDPLDGTLVTPGLNLYFTPINRIQVNYDLWRPGGTDRLSEGSFKAMFQFAF